ncbi:MAG: hypothetical protein GY847_39440 [Proteobacteria bacterium]|nr:hypothetical protein [Pseudomonadota bacterium]
MFAVYSGNALQPSEFSYNRISEYFEPDYVSGLRPLAELSTNPFTAVINLDDMTVMGRDTIEAPMTKEEILLLVAEANAKDQ